MANYHYVIDALNKIDDNKSNIMKFLNYNDDGLFTDHRNMPACHNNDVLIRVEASGINRADLLQIAGHYPPPAGASDIVGLEVAGTVERAPTGSVFSPGDRVMALLAGGGYAQYAAVDASSVMPLPDNLDFIQGAAIPEAFITAYQVLFEIGQLNQRIAKKSLRVLIHAGASGVGSAAIQLALAVGCEVFTTASCDTKLNALKEFGQIHLINYKTQDFSQHISEHTAGQGVDIIIDFIGGDYLNGNIDSIALDGIIINLAMLGGRFSPNFDFAKLLMKRATVTGTTLRNRSNEYKASLVADFSSQFLDSFSSGALEPVIDSSYQYSDVKTALDHIGANRNIGKLVLHSF